MCGWQLPELQLQSRKIRRIPTRSSILTCMHFKQAEPFHLIAQLFDSGSVGWFLVVGQALEIHSRIDDKLMRLTALNGLDCYYLRQIIEMRWFWIINI